MPEKELYKRYRPRKLEQVIGQDEAVKSIGALLATGFPHTSLLSGPTGCGKTTLAIIIAKRLGCRKSDYIVVNSSSFRGIDMVREVESRVDMMPMSGPVRVYLIDESHQLTAPAQDAFLKVLEETPEHTYFILATTDPQKLKRPLLNRCTKFIVKPLPAEALTELVTSVCEAEGIEVSERVRSKIVACADGSARSALVMLEKVIALEDESSQLASIQSEREVEDKVKELVNQLIFGQGKWPTVSGILKALKDEEPEQLRRRIIGTARMILLDGGKRAEGAYIIIEAFRDHVFDCGMSGLVASAYDIVRGR